MTVAENMAFGLQLKRYRKAEIESRCAEPRGCWTSRTARPQAQAVVRRPAPARCDGPRHRAQPEVFLFDEPLSNLDAKLRVQMRIEIKPVHASLRTTTIYVTHDQAQAMRLADRIVVMNDGRIVQMGPERALRPAGELFRRQLHRISADEFHSLPARGCRRQAQYPHHRPYFLPAAGRARRTISTPFRAPINCSRHPPRTYYRGHGPPEPGIEAFDAVLDVTEPMGMETLIYFTLEGAQVCGRVNPNAGAQDGAPLRLAVDLNNMHLLNEVTGAVL